MDSSMRVTEKNFSTGTVLKESILFYKNNFRDLFLLSIVLSFISFSYTAFNYLKNVNKGTAFGTLIQIAIAILAIPVLIFCARLQLTNILYIFKRYTGIDIKLKEAYIKSKELLWKYIIVSIQLGLILAVPSIGRSINFLYTRNPIQKLFIAFVLALLYLFLKAQYGFAPIAFLTEKDKKSYFRFSSELVKEDLPKVVILFFLTDILIYMPANIYKFTLTNWRALAQSKTFMISALQQSCLLFLTPLFCSITVIAYCKLRESCKRA